VHEGAAAQEKPIHPSADSINSPSIEGYEFPAGK